MYCVQLLTAVLGDASRLTNSPTYPRSQTNHEKEPTNRNYSWESGLFLPSLIRRTGVGERGVSDRPMSTHKLNHLEGEGWANQGGGGAW